MRSLIVLNDPPYGSERAHDGLQVALNLLTRTKGISLTVFARLETRLPYTFVARVKR